MAESFRHKWYRTKWNLTPIFHVVTKFPTCINIELAGGCNLNCTMCYRNLFKIKSGFMDVGLYKKIIDECVDHKLDSVKLSWRGESSLHRNFVDMVKYAKNEGIHEVSLNTNALLLNSSKIEGLIDSGLDVVLISVDGADKDTYEKIRKGGNYDILCKNINELVETRNRKGLTFPKIMLRGTMVEENRDTIHLLRDNWSKVVDDVFIEEEQVILSGQKNLSKRRPCRQLWQRLAITWDGNVAMCCNDWQPENVLGNVNTESIYSIWHGDKLNNIRKLHKQNRINEINVCGFCTCIHSY